MKNELQAKIIQTGICVGSLYFVEESVQPVPANLPVDGKKDSQVLLKTAIAKVTSHSSLLDEPKSQQIRAVQLSFLTDPKVKTWLEEELHDGKNLADAISLMLVKAKSYLQSSNSALFSRWYDLKDIWNEVLESLQPSPKKKPQGPSILVSKSPYPSILTRFSSYCTGIITEEGDHTSHLAILAKSCGIPYITLDTEAFRKLPLGKSLRLHVEEAEVWWQPATMENQSHTFLARKPTLEKESFLACGTKYHLGAALNLASEIPGLQKDAPQAIRLIRTEFFLYEYPIQPSFEEQLKALEVITTSFPDVPLTFRLFDIGGDKQPQFTRKERTTLRGASYLLHETEFLKQHLAALECLIQERPFQLLLPFAKNRKEVEELLSLCQQQSPILLEKASLGLMIESQELLDEVGDLSLPFDFFAVGTNDLMPVLAGVDRQDFRFSNNVCFSSPIFQALSKLQQLQEKGAPVYFCGEHVLQPAFLLLLLGYGFRDFTISWTSILDIVSLLSKVTQADAEKFAFACRRNNIRSHQTLFAEMCRKLEIKAK